MSVPAAALRFSAAGFYLGLWLGVWYSFLRPLRPRLTHFADGLFVAGMLAVWLYLGFGICAGDLRFGCTAAMFLGLVTWEATLGKVLRPLIRLFWQICGKVGKICLLPWKKFWILQKFCLQ